MKKRTVLNLTLTLFLLITILPPAATPPSVQAAEPVRWGFYVRYDPASLTSLQANVDKLTHLSPWYYNLNNAGDLTGYRDDAVNALARQHGVKLLPTIQNDPTGDAFHDIIADPAKRDRLIGLIRDLVQRNDYDGICIDFETLNAGDATLYADFTRRLSTALHADGRLLAMALVPKTSDVGGSFSGVYDYAALAPSLDYALIMAYDFHYVTGTPGPIAPVDWLGRVARYAVTRFAPGQILWGIGLYGFDWNTVARGRAQSLRYPDVAPLKAQFPPLTGGYDVASQAPYFTYYDANGQLHEVWYEDAASFAAKLNVIAPYNMAGVALWRLGHEDPAIWARLRPTPQPTACQPVAPFPNTQSRVYFAETGHSLANAFLNYWRARGGLPIYGYPITEEFAERSNLDGRTYTVQYFERARFEYHPENQSPYYVLLGQLGRDAHSGVVDPPATPLPGARYFAETGHNLSGNFAQYWQRYGGLAQFGYPLTEVVPEISPTDGRTYTVQYFERARFEYHPEYGGTFYEVLLGLVGKQFSPCQ